MSWVTRRPCSNKVYGRRAASLTECLRGLEVCFAQQGLGPPLKWDLKMCISILGQWGAASSSAEG